MLATRTFPPLNTEQVKVPWSARVTGDIRRSHPAPDLWYRYLE